MEMHLLQRPQFQQKHELDFCHMLQLALACLVWIGHSFGSMPDTKKAWSLEILCCRAFQKSEAVGLTCQ